VFIIAIGAGLLGMRQYRLNLKNDMTDLHQRMNAARKAIWDRQVRVTKQTRPGALREAIAQAELELEPVTPATQPAEAAASGGGARLESNEASAADE